MWATLCGRPSDRHTGLSLQNQAVQPPSPSAPLTPPDCSARLAVSLLFRFVDCCSNPSRGKLMNCASHMNSTDKLMLTHHEMPCVAFRSDHIGSLPQKAATQPDCRQKIRIRSLSKVRNRSFHLQASASYNPSQRKKIYQGFLP